MFRLGTALTKSITSKTNVMKGLVKPITTSGTVSQVSGYDFETLKVTSPSEFVYHVELNRPKKLNAMNRAFWREMVECFQKIEHDSDCRAIVLSGSGRIFTAGLDLMDAASILQPNSDVDVGRQAFAVRKTVKAYQQSFSQIEQCPKPVLVAVHNACVGGGVDMITACDIRYCTNDAWFQIKEIEIGIIADVGTLQRLPKVIGNDSLVRELAFTGRRLPAAEAKESGLVSRVFQDKESMLSAALETAATIASHSPVAVQGTKINLVYSRDHSVPDSLEYVMACNQGLLQSEDVMKAAVATMQKEKPKFSNL